MTPDELRKHFPNASLDLLARNTGQASKLERDPSHVPLAKKEVQGRDSKRFFICITSVRKRLIDQSNLCYKYHEDLCRYAGALPDDSPDICESQVRQIKAGKGEQEKIIIEIYKID
jgi:hypothetical protein